MADLYETVNLGTIAGPEDTAAVRKWLIAGAADYLARMELCEIDDAALFRRVQAAVHAGTTIVDAATSGQIGGKPVPVSELRALRSAVCDVSSALMDEVDARDAEDERVMAGAVPSRRETVLRVAALRHPELFAEDTLAYEQSGLDLGVSPRERLQYLPQPAAPAAA